MHVSAVVFFVTCPGHWLSAVGSAADDGHSWIHGVGDGSLRGDGKGTKDRKFELVGMLLCSSNAKEIFGAHNYLKLKTYLNEGPYYINAVPSVTTEGAD